MKRRGLLNLYPYRWRQRYAEEIGALLDDGQLSVATVLDVVRGAFDAHLHPELIPASLVASTGSGQIRLVPRSPRRRAALLVAICLTALSAWGLAQPLPFVPLILPIGAHASPVDFARSQAGPGQLARATLERDGLAVVLLANPSGTEQTLVTAYRASTGGWMGGGGGRSAGPPASAQLPIRTGYGTNWSAGGIPGARSFGFVYVYGVAADEVSRVDVVFADGSREAATMNQGAFLWFAGRWDVPAPSFAAPRAPAELEQQSFGRSPVAVIAYTSSGAELMRQDIRRGQ